MSDTPEQVKPLVEEIFQLLTEGQEHYALVTQQYGQAKDVFDGLRRLAKTNDDALRPGLQTFHKFRDYLAITQKRDKPRFDVSSAAFAAAGTATNVTAIAFADAAQFVDSYIIRRAHGVPNVLSGTRVAFLTSTPNSAACIARSAKRFGVRQKIPKEHPSE